MKFVIAVFSLLIFANVSSASSAQCYVSAAGQKMLLPQTDRIYRDTYTLEFQLIQNANGKIEIKPFTSEDANELAAHMPDSKVKRYLWVKELSIRIMTAQVRVYPLSGETKPTDEMHVLLGNLNYDVFKDSELRSVKSTAANPKPLVYNAPYTEADGQFGRTELKVYCDPLMGDRAH